MTFRYQAADVASGIARTTVHHGFDEQIFGGDEQVRGRAKSD
jgi:hypothetical protein